MWDNEIQTHAAGRSPKAPNTDPRHWRGWARALPAQKPTAHKKGPQTERRERTELSSPATSLLGSTSTWPLLPPTQGAGRGGDHRRCWGARSSTLLGGPSWKGGGVASCPLQDLHPFADPHSLRASLVFYSCILGFQYMWLLLIGSESYIYQQSNRG